jgi:hypothetical protein
MARKPATFSFSSYVASRKAQLREHRKTLASIEANAEWFRVASAVCESVAKVAKLHNACEWANDYPYVYNDNSLEFAASFEAPCTSLKEGAIPAILEAALAAGFEATTTDDSVTSYDARRNYRFTQTIGPVVVNLTVRASVKEADGATCRKVQVGTKIEEVAQFTLVCD